MVINTIISTTQQQRLRGAENTLLVAEVLAGEVVAAVVAAAPHDGLADLAVKVPDCMECAEVRSWSWLQTIAFLVVYKKQNYRIYNFGALKYVTHLLCNIGMWRICCCHNRCCCIPSCKTPHR